MTAKSGVALRRVPVAAPSSREPSAVPRQSWPGLPGRGCMPTRVAHVGAGGGRKRDGREFSHTRGSQFRSRKYVRALNRHHMVGSMGRVGAAGDNAAMESFFSLLQKNVLDRRSWATREEPRIAIVTWIERTYHRRRRQAALGRLTPTEFETIMTPPAVQAAQTNVSPERAADPTSTHNRCASTRTGRSTADRPRDRLPVAGHLRSEVVDSRCARTWSTGVARRRPGTARAGATAASRRCRDRDGAARSPSAGAATRARSRSSAAR